MRILAWEITRVKGMQVGGHRAHDEAIVDIQKRLDDLEHRNKVVTTLKEQDRLTDQAITNWLNNLPQRPVEVGNELDEDWRYR